MQGTSRNLSRRELLEGAIAAGAAASLPWFIPGRALGRDGATPPSERISLGVIGIGPRMTYDLGGVLPKADVRCAAICDVQKSRREAGKKLVDQRYGNKDCAVYRDFRELLARKDIDTVMIGTGDRWHAPASILAAKAGKDVYSEKPCGLTIGLCQTLDDTIRQTKRVFQAGTQRRSVANFQAAVQLAQRQAGQNPHPRRLGLRAVDRNGLAAGRADAAARRGRLGPLAWTSPLAALQPCLRRRPMAGLLGLRLRRPPPRLGRHTVDLCQWANAADDTLPIEYEPAANTITARYANGVKLVLDCLDTPFGQRPGWVQSLGTCPVRFVGDEGWVETGDSGGIEVHPQSLKGEIDAVREKRHSGLDVAAHTRNFFDCVRSRAQTAANSRVMRHSHTACHAAALAWILKRKLRLDPVKEAFIGDDEADGLRMRPARGPWAV